MSLSLDIALVSLRLLLGLLLIAHGLQKSLGWLGGSGRAKTSRVFHDWGFVPGPILVTVAALAEITSGTLIAIGLGTALGCAIAIGTLIVAMSPNFRNGFWAAQAGYELPFTYAAIAAVIAVAGSGELSMDRVVGLPSGGILGGIAIVVGVIGALPPLAIRRAELARR